MVETITGMMTVPVNEVNFMDIVTLAAAKKYTDEHGGGGGLPSPSSDGVALIGVNGEWKQVEGYGYEDGTIHIDLTGDYGIPVFVGDSVFLRVSSRILTKEEMTGGKAVRVKYSHPSVDVYEILDRTEYTISESDIYEDESGAISCKTGSYSGVVSYVGIISGAKGTVKYADYQYSTIELPEDGTYIHSFTQMPPSDVYEDKIEYIEPVGSVVKIDEKFIPEVEGTLPDPTDLPDGTALISVGGEWKKVEGYGYSEEGITIVWDGDTTGKEEFSPYPQRYKVFDDGNPIENPNAIIEQTWQGEIEESFLGEITWLIDEKAWATDGARIIGVPEDFEYNGITVHKGLYFYSYDGSDYSYISKFTVPETVLTIDPKFIPNDISKVNASDISHETWTFTLDDDTTVTKEVVTWTGQA